MKDEKDIDNKLEQEEEKEVLNPFHLEGHKPRTRREFMAQGFLGSFAFGLAPSLMSLLSSKDAFAADCATPTFKSKTPVIVIELAGGGNIPGSNVMVGGQGGQEDFMSAYNSLGLPPNMHPKMAGMINNEMGLVFHSDSGILRGIQSATSVSTRMNSEGAIFCATSADDTANNQFNPVFWLNKAGAKGQVNQLAGTDQSESGGRSKAPKESVNPLIAPIKITSSNDARNLVSLGNQLNSYDSSKMNKILDTMSELSNNKLNSIPRRSLPDAIKSLLDCSISQSKSQVASFGPNALDVNQDLVATEVMKKISSTGLRNRVAPIAKLVIDGYIGAGTIVLNGYDYHDKTRKRGEVADFQLGQIMGAIMELAAAKQKDVVIYVVTDGGVSTDGSVDSSPEGRGKLNWTGDSGQRSSSFMMVYKKDGKPRLRANANRQIGHFTNGVINKTAKLTSNSVINLAKAMVANYLALHGEEGKLAEVVNDNPFGSKLDEYLIFEKLR